MYNYTGVPIIVCYTIMSQVRHRLFLSNLYHVLIWIIQQQTGSTLTLVQ